MPAVPPAELLYGELDATTGALVALVEGENADLPIPACPGWTIRQLATHVGRAHRWAPAADVLLVLMRRLSPAEGAATGTGSAHCIRPAADPHLASGRLRPA
jgi:hypothetical protein